MWRPWRGWAAGAKHWRRLLAWAALPLILGPPAVPGRAAEPAAPTITIEGGNKALRDNIRANLAIAAQDCGLPQWRIARLLARIPAETAAAMRALGWYGGHVSDKRIERTPACWHLHLQIEPGKRVHVTALQVTIRGAGRHDPAFAPGQLQLPLQQGAPLHHGRYEQSKRKLLKLALQRGYFDAKLITHRLRVLPDQHEARVELELATGPRYRIGELRLSHDQRLRTSFIQRFINIEAGEPFHSSRLVTLQRNLNDGGYFDRVEVSKRLAEAEHFAVPIDIELATANRHAYTIGAGAATDTGPRLRLGYSNLYITRRGHRFAGDGLLSPVRQEISGSYTIPLDNPLDEQYRLNAGWQREVTDTSESWQISTRFARIDLLPGNWIQTLSVDYEREDFDIAGEARRTYLLYPGIGLQKHYSDAIALPQDAWRLRLQARGSRRLPVSDLTFLQGKVAGKLVRGVPGGRLLARVDAGATEVDQISRLPASLRFFAGGDASIRGYAYQGLGPRDSDGDIVGGRYLLVASLEYEWIINPTWGIALFYDAGKAFNDLRAPFDRGVGGGLRWRSPIGPIRVDLAHPVGKQGIRLHLSMGPDV